jgi:signal peptidase I
LAENPPSLKKLRGEGGEFLKQAQKLRKKHDAKLGEVARAALDKVFGEAAEALAGDDAEALDRVLKRLEGVVEQHLGRFRKSTAREYVESIGVAVAFALVLRAFVVEAFIIPSASMEPTLQEGDRLFVNKGSYGVRVPFTTTRLIEFSPPSRGDVVVFVFPREEARAHTSQLPLHRRGCVDPASLREEKDYIKRVVGVPGDKIQLINNQLHVNGQAVKTEPLEGAAAGKRGGLAPAQQREYHDKHVYVTQHHGMDSNFGLDEAVVVKEGHVFVMGDNRDNSSDSRCWGQVPMDNIKGRAMFIWWSSSRHGYAWERIGKVID